MREREIKAGFTYPRGHNRPIHLTVFNPDGQVLKTWDITGVLSPELLITGIGEAADAMKATKGPPLVRPLPLREACHAASDLLLESITRYDVRADQVEPYNRQFFDIGATPPGWVSSPPDMFPGRVKAPARDRFAWTQEQAAGLLRGADLSGVGSRWAVDFKVLRELLVHFTPQSEVYRLDPSKVVETPIVGEVMERRQGKVQVRLSGQVDVKHPWWSLPCDDEHLEASFTAWLSYDEATHACESLSLASDGATYRGGKVRPRLAVPMRIVVRTLHEGS